MTSVDPPSEHGSEPAAARSTPSLPTSLDLDGDTVHPAVAKLHDLSRRERALIVTRLVLRIMITTTLLVLVYYVAPFDRDAGATEAWTLVLLGIGLVLLVAMIAWQTRLIVNADYPGLRAIEALAVTTPFYLIIFAATYFLIGRSDPGAFSEGLDRTGSLYFTITVFATVGFGDIAAKTQLARVVVMIQMILDLLILGIGLRLFLGAVKVGQRRRETRSGQESR